MVKITTMSSFSIFKKLSPKLTILFCSINLGRSELSKFRVGTSLSKVRDAPSGVPQGSVLSPVLFNIYTFDLLSLVVKSGVQLKMFADDLKVYYPVNGAASPQLQHAIDTV
ncbi:hypothetical protein COOONC_23439, partial [Cooperia oncophora]